mmetsp:Transcript_130635/g.194612  ORF Transcript_130635/g.194612 Transcript_130635/m.194612 type:complete len:88 (+) Transcript_130635:84-347(+)
MESIKYFDAHKTKVKSIKLNPEGNRLATCSDKGTLIRIYGLPSCEKIYTLQRGVERVQIYSMNFTYDSNYLACSSSTGSTHFFRLDD